MQQRRKYLRIQVRINLANPIMRGVTVELGTSKKEKMCPLEYEYLPEFCYTCGIIGHDYKACKIQLETGEKQQYGRWLKAFVPKRRTEAEKGRWGKTSGAGGWRSSNVGAVRSRREVIVYLGERMLDRICFGV
jgi:hypothetical protein